MIRIFYCLGFLFVLPVSTAQNSGSSKSSTPLIPEAVVTKLLASYSAEEKELIDADLSMIRSLTFRSHKPSSTKLVYIGTAGGPLSRKSTILEKVISDDPAFKNAVYLDPDPRGLKLMANTYIARSLANLEIYKTQDIQLVRRNAYEKWRDASNFITNTLINEAFKDRFDMAHGTTLTGGASPHFLKGLKDAGYEITLLLAFAPENFKKSALEFRNEIQGFYQATPEDIVEKAKLFPQRMKDYFAFADHIQLFWSESLGDKISPAATWSKAKVRDIADPAAYKKIVGYYNDFQTKNPEYPSWEKLF